MRKKLILTLIFCITFFSSNVLAKNVIIFGWDGAGRTTTELLLSQGKLPNLKRILDQGGAFVPMVAMGRTDTAAGWTQILTGLTADQSGVEGLIRWDPAASQHLMKWNDKTFLAPDVNYWYFHLPSEWSLFYPFQQRGGIVGFFPVKPYVGSNPDESPLMNIALSADEFQEFLPYKNGMDDYIWRVRDRAVKFIEDRKADGKQYFLFFMSTPDRYGHTDGYGSDRYKEEFSRSDEVLGTILNVIDPLNTSILIMVDHGFDHDGWYPKLSNDKFFHRNANDLWAVTDLPISGFFKRNLMQNKRNWALAKTIDILPTLWRWWGIDASQYEFVIRPQVRGNILLDFPDADEDGIEDFNDSFPSDPARQ